MKQTVKTYALALACVVAATGILAARVVPQPGVGLTSAQLFDDGVLHRIELQISQRDWDTLRANFTLNTYYPATFLWRGETVRNVAVRSRGSGTRSGTKPGILVDFDRYVGGQRFLGLKALVLDNHLQDPSAMREALTMAVHARVGLPAPREAPAALFINGGFLGIYTMVENLDSVAVSRMFDPGADSAPLPTVPGRTPSAGASPGGPPQIAIPRQPSAVSAVEPLPTGYLFEYNWLDYFWGSYPGPDLDFYSELLEAETREDEPLETTHRPIEVMFREINEAPDEQFVERVGPHLDLRGFVKLAAVQAFMAEWDGVVGSFGFNNFYLYRPAAGGPHVFIPWDEDNAFYDPAYRVDAEFERHILMRRAMNVPELRQLFIETLEAVAALAEAKADSHPAGWLAGEVERRGDMVTGLMTRDRVTPFSQADFEAAVAYNIDFARRRPSIVREQLRGFRDREE